MSIDVEKLIDDNIPDGAAEEDNPSRLQSWIVLIAGFIVHIYGVYQVEYLVNEFPNTPATTIAWIGTLMFFGIAFFGLFAGLVCEKFDPRYACMCGVLVVGGSMTPLALLLTQGILFGVGAGFIDVISIIVPTQWFPKHPGSGAWFASVGRPWAMRITGFIMLGLGLPCSWLLKPRTKIVREGKFLDFSLLFDVRYALLFVGSLLSMASFFSPFYYMPSYSVNFSTKLQMVLNLTSLVSRLFIDQITCRIGALNTLLLSTLAGTVGIAIFWLPFKNMVAADLFGGERLGTTLGVIYFGYSVATLITSPVNGVLLDNIGHKTDYSSLIIYCSVQLVVATVALVVLRLLVSRKFIHVC
ncbi:MFS general substrate transporter [Linderina pennispora]|uniref:MFS general substrate transporter n=1 Tax=Linderina pennispora TaxID=61395 RepID=A0A1Y1W128_9FUNG|nr:MFS general substrate transporter [Linderina pennispora]ORX66824.1 MFS general substrate transporter [Linderina pennispora]